VRIFDSLDYKVKKIYEELKNESIQNVCKWINEIYDMFNINIPKHEVEEGKDEKQKGDWECGYYVMLKSWFIIHCETRSVTCC
jgi:hypothetical protein